VIDRTEPRTVAPAGPPVTAGPAILAPPARRYGYETDGAAIYRASFATIRAETDLSGLPEDAHVVAVRMVHACGQTDLVRDLVVHPRLVAAARAALRAGAPIFTDAHMVASGITRARLPADNPVHCLLRDERVPALARDWGTTRSAAAVSLWGAELEGAVVAVGNAPTALFHLLELIADGGPRPAAVVGVPVGFIGATESKDALAEFPGDVPFLTVRGRRGGSAMAASAVNALAREQE
jgi:precorrin-8X/cobalt-precorrin-8 methylmutase